ncbi:MAG: putative membrane protein YphA (DoxX/SURF4 family) [Roseivirga sp.]|jgi:uncharacterized membrane protein YphA (DoxX/SURF4 family)
MTLNRYKLLDLFVLALRFYLAYYMITYGWSKMMGGQFGAHDPSILDQPMNQIDKFYITWYLFSLSPVFDIVVGLTQILGGLLIGFNKTVLLGALLLLPILFQIFLIDLSFTTNVFGMTLPVRLAGMIFADLFILFYHKERMLQVWSSLVVGFKAKVDYKWWVYLLFIPVGFLMDFVFAIVTLPIKMLINLFLN